MSNYENIKQLFNELKSHPTVDVSKTCGAIIELFPLILKTEQKEFIEVFYKWTEQQATVNPLVFYYGKLTLALNHFYNEHFTEALPLLVETQKLLNELNDQDGIAMAMVLQGAIYRTYGNFDLALKNLWAGYEQLKKSDNLLYFQLACRNAMAGIFLDMQQYEKAIPLFKDNLEKSEPAGKYYWTVYALQGLGKIYLAQKKYPESKECFEKAMVVSENSRHPLSVCNSLSEFANYYFTTGDYSGAEQLHIQSLSLREENQFIAGAITNCIRLGEIYIRQFRPDDAIAILEKGLKMAKQIEVKLKMYQIHLLLSQIYKSKNEPAKSLFHYEQFHELKEQVELEDSERKLKNAQMVFEAEQTLKENIIIKKQKQEIERKNIELQETIDELTRARIGKKARAITLGIAIIMFIFEDTILHFALKIVPEDSYFASLIVKMVIIFSLSPINKAVEHYLLKKVIKKKKKEVLI